MALTLRPGDATFGEHGQSAFEGRDGKKMRALQRAADAFFLVDDQLTTAKAEHKIAKMELELAARELGRRAWVGNGLVVVQGELFATNDDGSGEPDEGEPRHARDL